MRNGDTSHRQVLVSLFQDWYKPCNKDTLWRSKLSNIQYRKIMEDGENSVENVNLLPYVSLWSCGSP